MSVPHCAGAPQQELSSPVVTRRTTAPHSAILALRWLPFTQCPYFHDYRNTLLCQADQRKSWQTITTRQLPSSFSTIGTPLAPLHLPEHRPQHAQPEFGIGGGQFQ